MATQIRVSRHGLTACPSCSRHIRVVRDDWRATVCPFCDLSLAESIARFCEGKTCAAERPSSVLQTLRSMVGARGSAVAASLLSLSLMSAGCEDAPVVPLYGIPPGDAGPSPDAQLVDSGEPLPQPEYGLPPEDASVAADGGQAPDAGHVADAGPLPDAGANADAAAADAAAADAEAVDSGEPPVTPLYGISPPIKDGGL